MRYLARARKPGGRLNRQDIDNAKADLKIKGFTNKTKVLQSMPRIQDLFNEAANNIQQRRTNLIKAFTPNIGLTPEEESELSALEAELLEE